MIRKGQLSEENIPAYKQFMALAGLFLVAQRMAANCYTIEQGLNFGKRKRITLKIHTKCDIHGLFDDLLVLSNLDKKAGC
jgi:hypothetical protein